MVTWCADSGDSVQKSHCRTETEAGSRIAHSAFDNLACADMGLEEGKPFAYRAGERVLTGDALLIDGCGRTGAQSAPSARR